MLPFIRWCLILISLVVSRANAQCLTWVNVTPPVAGPQPRYDHAAAFNSDLGRMVVFGGTTALGTYSGETWEWDGSNWKVFAPVSPPPPRRGAAMCYDPVRKETILFGGETSSGVYSSQTWTWNGSTWTLRTQAGPAPRYNATMSFDTARGVAVMHGGRGYAGILSDTWEWNGTTWVFKAFGPKLTTWDWRAAMAFDQVRAVTIIAGLRQVGSDYNSESWQWDGQAWTPVPIGSLPALADAAMAFDPVSGQMKIYAGSEVKSFGSLVSSRVWSLDPGNGWYEVPDAAYSLRRGHTLLLDEAGGRLIVYGGHNNGGTLPDVSAYELASGTWSIVSGPNPGSLWTPLLAMDAPRGVVTMLAGGGATWEWNGSSWRLASVLGPDRPIGLVHDAASETLLAPDVYADVWEWDGFEWTRHPKPPGVPGGPSSSSRSMFDEQFGELVVHAYYDKATWAWNGGLWQLWSTSGPSASEPGFTYDSNRLVGVSFGGGVGSALADDTWEWDGFFWTKRADIAPLPGRDYLAMAYNPQRATSMVFGGRTNTSNPPALAPNDVWEWNGSAWTKPATGGPTARYGAGMTFDTERGEMVLFGGANASDVSLADTWVLRSSASFLDHPDHASVKEHQDAAFHVQAVGALSYSWRKDGQVIQSGAKYAGTNSPDLTVFDALASDEGEYQCAILDACAGVTLSKPATLTVNDSDIALLTGFEPPIIFGSQSGAPLTNQEGWYNPGSGTNYNVFIYPSSVHGFVPNPLGESQFIVGRREGANQTARAAHDIDLDANARWAFVADVAARFDGALPAEPDLGVLIAHPDVTARGFRAVLTWDDPQVCDTYSIHFEGYDVIGQPAMFDPGPEFKNLQANHWYRIAAGIDFDTNTIRWVQIRDLHAGPRMTFFKVGWYMRGGFNPDGDRADTFWVAATGGTGATSGEGNTVAWDNVAVRYDTFCDADCELDLDLDLFDFLCFQQKFVEQDPYADFEGDGDWDLFDYLTFQGAFAKGC